MYLPAGKALHESFNLLLVAINVGSSQYWSGKYHSHRDFWTVFLLMIRTEGFVAVCEVGKTWYN